MSLASVEEKIMLLLQQQLTTDLKRRAELLNADITDWKSLTEQNVDGLGIHRSQLAAVNATLEELLPRQKSLLGDLEASSSPDNFLARRLLLEQAIIANHALMSVFRNILEQRRETSRYNQPLDAADLIASDCYRTCMEAAQGMGIIKEDQFRVPPLIYLDSKGAAGAITRQKTVRKAFNLSLTAYLELKMPISVITIPYTDTVALWSFCGIAHEVGHLLDQDLQLGSALKALLEQADVVADFSKDTMPYWQLWLSEIIGDIFGVLLGGAAFAYNLMDILRQPKGDVFSTDLGDAEHPNPYVRFSLCCAMLRRTNVAELVAVADAIMQSWAEIYPLNEVPPELSIFVPESEKMADLLLGTRLDVLKQNRLLDFVPTLAKDHALVENLATFLRTDKMRPSPANFPYRFVAAAAQTAVRDIDREFVDVYEGVHQRALSFVKDIPRPTFLANPGFTQKRERYLRNLVKELDYSKFFS
jgi:hypothetical protein